MAGCHKRRGADSHLQPVGSPLYTAPRADDGAAAGACDLLVDGGIAQLVERLNGIQKVMGSNPFTSTNPGHSARVFACSG